MKPTIVIVTPALPDSNNGNGQTSLRYCQHLSADFKVHLCTEWQGPDESGVKPDLMIAIHAKKSASSIRAWAAFKSGEASSIEPLRPVPGLIVMLSGTDLYCDLDQGPVVEESMALASHLIVLQAQALNTVPCVFHHKVTCIHQCVDLPLSPDWSCKPEGKSPCFSVLMVGHMRAVKDPLTYLKAARLLASETEIHWRHMGRCTDEAFLPEVRETQVLNPNYQWLGGGTHQETLRQIARADLLVHCSVAEGSPHVVIEAMHLGTPVLASEVEGHIGTLGPEYGGYFPVGDHEALAHRVLALHQAHRLAQSDGVFLTLARQVSERAAHFTSQGEKKALLALINEALP